MIICFSGVHQLYWTVDQEMMHQHNSFFRSIYKSNMCGPPYLQVIRSKTYHGYGKPRIILNVIY